MLLGRAFAYSDTHRYRIGPTTSSSRSTGQVEVNSYTLDGPMAYGAPLDAPVYAPNSFGRGYADQVGEVDDGWEADGAMVRQAYTLREDDDDFAQAGALVREVWSDEQRDAFVQTVAGHLLGGVEGDVLERAFQYWHQVDADCGKRIESIVRDGADLGAPGAQPGNAAEDASDPVSESTTHADG